MRGAALICEHGNEYPQPVWSCRISVLSGFRCVSIILEKRISTVASAKHPNFKKHFLLLMSKRCMCVFSSSAPPSMKRLSHQLNTPPARLSPPPNYLQLNSEVPARKSNANPFEVDRASRLWQQLSSSNALSPSSIQKHMSKHERVPGSISQSIVCQLCQQTEGKLFHTHLNPGNLNHSFLIQTDKHAGHIQQICIAHLWLRSTRCHFLGELKIFGHHNLQYEIERHIFTHEKKKGGGLGLNHFLD